MFTIITLALIFWFVYWMYKKVTKSEEKKSEPEQTFSDELKKETQEDFYKIEKYYKSFDKQTDHMIDIDCLRHMILKGELKFSSGKIVTADLLDNYIRYRSITEICLNEGYNPRKKEDREIAEALLDLEGDDESDDDSSYDDWDDYEETSNQSSRSSESGKAKEYGSYVIQYRDSSGGSWVDGPGSNSESVAESMFDNFLRNDPRNTRRCRLVYKVNGRVQSVLGTN